MTKRLECIVDGCNETIEAESEDQVMSEAQAHAAKEHPDMEIDAEAQQRIRSQIEDV